MNNDLEKILEQAQQEIITSNDLQTLDHYRIHYLGKKGKITEVLKNLGQLPAEERPLAGQKINVVKQKIQESLDHQLSKLQKKEIEAALHKDAIDITLPGRLQEIGSLHPVTKIRER